MSLLLPLCLALSVRAADGVWTGGAGSWTGPANWQDGVIAGAGGAAAFTGAGGAVTVPAGSPFTLSMLLFNTNGVGSIWSVSGETNTLAFPAVIRVDTNEVSLVSALAGTAGLRKVGAGVLNLDNTHNAVFLSGPISVDGGGVLRSHGDAALGAVPAPDDMYNPPASALSFDDGGLASWGEPLTLAPGRGITVNAGGMWFLARSTLGIHIPSKITGAGPVRVARENSAVTFSNPANDYAGDTVLGSKDNGWWNSTEGLGRLVLGADEVIPDGPGKGVLRFVGDRRGTLDLNGHSETVNSLDALNGFILGNGAANPGVLTAGVDNAALRIAGDIGGGATLAKTGAGTLAFYAGTASTGTLRHTQGPLVFSSGEALGGLTLVLDGGSLQVAAESEAGLTERTAPAGAWNVNAALAFNNVRPGTEKGYLGNTDFGTYRQWGYFGQWHVPEAGVYSFAKSFDDAASLKLDGQLLLNNASSSGFAVTQNVAVAAGWHDVEIRFFNGSGVVGPYSGHRFTAGIVFDPGNSALNTPELQAAAFRFEDGASGTSLRTTPLGTATNTVRARLELAQDGTLDRSGAAASPLVWSGDLVTAADAAGSPTLTVTGGNGPFLVGSTDYHTPTIFDVDVAGGVTFQDRLWIKSWPASSAYTVQPGAELAEGTPGILGTGDLTLADWSLRIVHDDSAIGDVTVPNGRFVRFDATREAGGRLVHDPAYVLAADNDVALGGTGAGVSFNGAGSVVYFGVISGTGWFISGTSGDLTLTGANTFTGPLSLNSGRLLVSSDDALGAPANVVTFNGGWLSSADGVGDLTLGRAITTSAAGGGIDAPEGATLSLTGPLSGTLGKQGAGTLAIGGTEPNPALDLAVDAGTVTLDKNGAVRNITRVAADAAVRLDGSGGDLITGIVNLTGGTLDLNGHSETLGVLNADPASSISRVVNNGTAPATLTVGTNNTFGAFRGGWFADGAAPLALTKVGAEAFWFLGGAEPVSYTGPTRVEAGTLNWGCATRYVRFTVLATRSVSAWASVSEFQILLDGKGIPHAAVATADAATAANPAGNLLDNNADTRWQAPNSTVGHWFKLDFGRAVAMDGYRWFTHTAGVNDDPVSWRVEVSSDNATWYTVDEQANVPVPTERRFLAGEWLFGGPRAGGLTASPHSAVTVAAGAVAQLNSPRETIPSLAGAGTLSFVPGAALRVEDASGFSGGLAGAGRLEFVDAAPGPLAGIPSGTALVNAGAEPLAVRVGGAADGAFAAAVRDGASPAGLRKTGPSVLTLFGADSDYTGDTVVEAGTLAVSAASSAYRYVRFSTSEVRDPNGANNSGRVSLSEFHLTLSGSPIAWPAGTAATAFSSLAGYGPEKAIDGDWITSNGRWIGTGHVNWLKLDLQQPTAFDGYQFYTATDAAYDWSRDPVSWTFEGSNDGAAWTLLDSHTQNVYPDQRSARIGPFIVGGAPSPVPPEFWAVTNGCADTVGAVAVRYLRFTPTRMRLGAYEYPTGAQFAELELRLDGTTVPYPDGTVATAPGGGYNVPAENNVLTPDKVVDNILPTQQANNRWYSQSLVNPLTVDMGAPVTFNGYRIWTASNGAGRDPLSWTLEISADGTQWFLADTQTNQWGTLTRSAVAGEWRLKLPARAGRLSGAIPDASRMRVEAGATLLLDGAAERVGPLSGAGAVTLRNGATLDLNLFEDEVFAGTVGGPGTLALAGGHAQFFTGADAAPGDLAVDFRGGRFGGTLRIGGALTVTGPVAYAQPAAFPAAVTLFTFGSIDADSRAALIAGAASVAVPSGMVAKVTVSNDSAVLSVNSPGTVILVR